MRVGQLVTGNHPTPIVIAMDASGPGSDRIATALPCGRCDYDLRGLPLDGVCPECAFPVARSRLGEAADPAWLERLAWGVRLLEISVTLALIAWIVYAVLGLIIAMASWANDLAGFVTALGGAILTIGVIIGVGGLWQVTTPQGGRIEPEPWMSSRRVTRLIPVALAIYLAALAAAQFMPRIGLVSQVAAIVAIQLALAGVAVLAARLRWIAARLPEGTLVRRFTSIVRVAIFVSVIGIILLAISGFGGVPAIWVRLGALIILFVVVFTLPTLASSLPALRRELTMAATIAREAVRESS